MARWLFAKHRLTGAPSEIERRLIHDLRPLLQTATGVAVTDPAGDGSFIIDLPGKLLATSPHKRVRVSVGAYTKTSSLLSIPLSWHADPAAAFFPRFRGSIDYEPWSRSSGELMLVGTYTGPLGPVGSIGEAMGAHAVADRTADLLLRRVVRELQAAIGRGETTATVTGPGIHVADVMTYEPIVFDDDMPLRTAALVLLWARISGAPVVDRTGALIGILSEADLLDKEAGPLDGWRRSVTARRRRVDARTVGQACTRPALVTAPDSTLREAAEEMATHDVGRLVVLDGARVAGIITRHDVLRALVRTDAELEADVQQRLVALDAADDVRVMVEDGVVSLHGRAPTSSIADAWVQAARRVDGVIDVEDQLKWEFDDLLVIGES